MSAPGAGVGAVRAKYPQMIATSVVMGTSSVEVPAAGRSLVARRAWDSLDGPHAGEVTARGAGEDAGCE